VYEQSSGRSLHLSQSADSKRRLLTRDHPLTEA
jgi:hypothetical protein